MLRVAIIADDLTGAFDASAPFAIRGLHVVVALDPDAVASALAQKPQVLTVNTASREITAALAAERVGTVARQLAAAQPEYIFKKIDSRLKGHVATESAAVFNASARRLVLVAPAVPRQGRFVRGGMVVGAGVPAPLSIAEAIGAAFRYECPDSEDQPSLIRMAAVNGKETLLVGASGLAEGLAIHLATHQPEIVDTLPGPMLVAIGSHDPITLTQIERVIASGMARHISTTDGSLAPISAEEGLTIVQAVTRDGDAMARFGRSVADLLQNGSFASVLISGGETAQTVLGALGVRTVVVHGEPISGIAATVARLGYRDVTILTKSGGFGTPDDILHLARLLDRAKPATSPDVLGERA